MRGFSLSDDELIGTACVLVAAGCFYGAYRAFHPVPRWWLLGIMAVLAGVFASFWAYIFFFWKMNRLF